MIEKNLASSVGIIGRSYSDPGNERVKFCTDLITDISTLNKRNKSFLKEFNDGISRVTGRFIIRDGLIARDIPNLEARIPLDGEFDDFSLVYLGINSFTRMEDKFLIAAEVSMAKSIDDNIKTISYNNAIKRIKDKGFSVVSGNVLKDIDPNNIIELYNEAYKGSYTFDLTHENVTNLLNNPNNIKAVVVNSDGKVVSIGVAEVSKCSLSGRDFRFAELSDAATYDSYKRMGLYTATSSALMQRLAEEDIDLIYGEARACHKGVNLVCRRSGRNFYGLLNKHCKISGEKDINEFGPYENLNVWAVTGSKLKKIMEMDN